MNNDTSVEIIKQALLVCPETGKKLYVSSEPVFHPDGSYTFETLSEDGKQKWKHTILTEEF